MGFPEFKRMLNEHSIPTNGRWSKSIAALFMCSQDEDGGDENPVTEMVYAEVPAGAGASGRHTLSGEDPARS